MPDGARNCVFVAGLMFKAVQLPNLVQPQPSICGRREFFYIDKISDGDEIEHTTMILPVIRNGALCVRLDLQGAQSRKIGPPDSDPAGSRVNLQLIIKESRRPTQQMD